MRDLEISGKKFVKAEIIRGLISGSLKNAFGVQKIVPIVEQPKGTTVLSLNFSPSPAKSVTNEMTQQTTDTTKPDLESQTKTKDSDGNGQKQSDADDLVKALQEAIARCKAFAALGADVVYAERLSLVELAQLRRAIPLEVPMMLAQVEQESKPVITAEEAACAGCRPSSARSRRRGATRCSPRACTRPRTL